MLMKPKLNENKKTPSVIRDFVKDGQIYVYINDYLPTRPSSNYNTFYYLKNHLYLMVNTSIMIAEIYRVLLENEDSLNSKSMSYYFPVYTIKDETVPKKFKIYILNILTNNKFSNINYSLKNIYDVCNTYPTFNKDLAEKYPYIEYFSLISQKNVTDVGKSFENFQNILKTDYCLDYNNVEQLSNPLNYLDIAHDSSVLKKSYLDDIKDCVRRYKNTSSSSIQYDMFKETFTLMLNSVLNTENNEQFVDDFLESPHYVEKTNELIERIESSYSSLDTNKISLKMKEGKDLKKVRHANKQNKFNKISIDFYYEKMYNMYSALNTLDNVTIVPAGKPHIVSYIDDMNKIYEKGVLKYLDDDDQMPTLSINSFYIIFDNYEDVEKFHATLSQNMLYPPSPFLFYKFKKGGSYNKINTLSDNVIDKSEKTDYTAIHSSSRKSPLIPNAYGIVTTHSTALYSDLFSITNVSERATYFNRNDEIYEYCMEFIYENLKPQLNVLRKSNLNQNVYISESSQKIITNKIHTESEKYLDIKNAEHRFFISKASNTKNKSLSKIQLNAKNCISFNINDSDDSIKDKIRTMLHYSYNTEKRGFRRIILKEFKFHVPLFNDTNIEEYHKLFNLNKIFNKGLLGIVFYPCLINDNEKNSILEKIYNL